MLPKEEIKDDQKFDVCPWLKLIDLIVRNQQEETLDSSNEPLQESKQFQDEAQTDTRRTSIRTASNTSHFRM